ncbi:MAG TPA: hypothetical protein VKW08_13070 [Xanthobacteraceae bacterium]|nr:hypothetical protein [Xanthobacteraceae bacterium]
MNFNFTSRPIGAATSNDLHAILEAKRLLGCIGDLFGLGLLFALCPGKGAPPFLQFARVARSATAQRRLPMFWRQLLTRQRNKQVRQLKRRKMRCKSLVRRIECRDPWQQLGIFLDSRTLKIRAILFQLKQKQSHIRHYCSREAPRHVARASVVETPPSTAFPNRMLRRRCVVPVD